jgi:hypothetical protein
LGGAVVGGEDLAGGEHEVVADGGVRVGVVVRGERALGDEGVEIGPDGSGADDSGVALVLFHDKDDVVACGDGGWRRCVGLHGDAGGGGLG